MDTTQIVSLETRHFEEMQQALNTWDHEYRQISPGEFHGSLLLTQTASVGIFRNRWERGIHYRGTPPPETLAFAVTLAQTAGAHWNGQSVTVDDVILASRGLETEYFSAPLWDSVVFAVPEARFAQQLADLSQQDPECIIGRSAAFRFAPQLAAQVRRVCIAYLQATTHSLTDPNARAALPEMAKFAVELMARALVRSQPVGHSSPTLNRSRGLLRKAEEYVAQLTDQPLRISGVCKELGVPERTLREAFQKLTDMSPLEYLKRQRLNAVYRALLKADPNEQLVKQVACDHGFNHPGQFGQDYKQLFAEMPSQTLQRRPVR
jgi:AraC family ethanolamine operon transcriptional activator